MVDLAKTANLVFFIEITQFPSHLSPPTVFVVEFSNFNASSFMVPSYRLALYRTIDPLGSPWWSSQKPPIWSSILRKTNTSSISPPTVLTVEISNFNPFIFMVRSCQFVLYRMTDPLGSPWWTSQKPPIWFSI